VAASIGTALFSVILTNQIKDSAPAGAYLASRSAEGDQGVLAAIAGKFGLPLEDFVAFAASGQAPLADAFATVFIVATILVACCLVPAAFLPRRKVAPVDPTAMMGH
jgi:hypothetical protein